MKFTVYYSIQNGGDGSAFPVWMESHDLAEWDQEHMSEGWGENCCGYLNFDSDSPITPNFEIQTKESYFLDLLPWSWEEDLSDKLVEFIQDFFPDGLPEFDVISRESGKYTYNDVYVKGRCIKKNMIKSKSKTDQTFGDYLNSIQSKIK